MSMAALAPLLPYIRASIAADAPERSSAARPTSLGISDELA
jgi:hypothetical protein